MAEKKAAGKKKEEKKEKIAFIISQIGKEGSADRRRIDGIIRVLLAPVLEELDYKPLASHEIDDSGSIPDQIIEQLLNAELVVCDLTFNNPNVMYELAIRHAAYLPVVLIAEEETKIPFDIGDQRTTFFKNDPLGLDEFKPILKTKIEAALKQEKPKNPISKVVGYESIIEEVTASGDDAQKYLLDKMSEMSSKLDRIVQPQTLATMGFGGKERLRSASDIVHDYTIYRLNMLAEGAPDELENLHEYFKSEPWLESVYYMPRLGENYAQFTLEMQAAKQEQILENLEHVIALYPKLNIKYGALKRVNIARS